MNDIRFGLSPVLNISGVDMQVALARAATCERVSITIDHIADVGEMVLPVRIIEGMGDIAARGYVTEEQMPLMKKLLELLSSSPRLQSWGV